jgi:hypothetical protein
VFVDDFIAVAQGNQHRLRTVRRTLTPSTTKSQGAYVISRQIQGAPLVLSS